MRKVMQGVALLAAWPGAASAQGQCASYLGQSVTPISFDAAVARYAGLTPRSEFETTAEFEARRARQTGGTGPLIIGKIPDPQDYGNRAGRGDYFRYDADRGVMRVVQYAFDNVNFDTDVIWGYGQPLHRDGDYTSRMTNLDVVISESERVTGSYIGTNAYGVRARVLRTIKTVNVIYERPLTSMSDDGLFRLLPRARSSIGIPVGDPVVGEIPMSPAEARVLKNTMTVAFVVVPKEPFFVTGQRRRGGATIDFPRETTLNARVLFADIQCGLVLDPRGRVLASYATN